MAELLGVSRQSVHRWRQKNKIPSWRLKDLHRLVAEGAIDGVEVTDD